MLEALILSALLTAPPVPPGTAAVHTVPSGPESSPPVPEPSPTVWEFDLGPEVTVTLSHPEFDGPWFQAEASVSHHPGEIRIRIVRDTGTRHTVLAETRWQARTQGAREEQTISMMIRNTFFRRPPLSLEVAVVGSGPDFFWSDGPVIQVPLTPDLPELLGPERAARVVQLAASATTDPSIRKTLETTLALLGPAGVDRALQQARHYVRTVSPQEPPELRTCEGQRSYTGHEIRTWLLEVVLGHDAPEPWRTLGRQAVAALPDDQLVAVFRAIRDGLRGCR